MLESSLRLPLEFPFSANVPVRAGGGHGLGLSPGDLLSVQGAFSVVLAQKVAFCEMIPQVLGVERALTPKVRLDVHPLQDRLELVQGDHLEDRLGILVPVRLYGVAGIPTNDLAEGGGLSCWGDRRTVSSGRGGCLLLAHGRCRLLTD